MSNVFRRYHTPTGNEYYNVSIEIEVALVPFLMNEKNVPKRHRLTYASKIIANLHRMQDFITDAKTIYPTTEELVKEKKMAFQNAINSCERVFQGLQLMVFIITSIDVDKLDRVGQLLLKESALLRDCRSKVKLQQQKK